MNTFLLPSPLIYGAVFFFLILLGIIIFMIYQRFLENKNDKIIIIDKTNRWRLYNRPLFNKTSINISDKKYYLAQESGLLNEQGKALYMFAENKPQPIKLSYNKVEWISAESLKAMINNDLIGLMVKLKDQNRMLMILGAIGGIIAGCSSVLILLITTGVINIK